MIWRPIRWRITVLEWSKVITRSVMSTLRTTITPRTPGSAILAQVFREWSGLFLCTSAFRIAGSNWNHLRSEQQQIEARLDISTQRCQLNPHPHFPKPFGVNPCPHPTQTHATSDGLSFRGRSQWPAQLEPGRLDLALVVSDIPAAAAGVFTQNRVVAAPVHLCKERLPRTTPAASSSVPATRTLAPAHKGWQTHGEWPSWPPTLLAVLRSKFSSHPPG